MEGNGKNNKVQDEVNMYLQDQILQLHHENAMLRKDNEAQELLLKENERKMKDAKVKSFDLKNSNNNKNEFITATQLASSKIVELTKKLREKNCEVESLKTKCAKLEAAISESDVLKEKVVEQEEKPKHELEEQIKKLQDKLNIASGKFMEIKNANFQLKNDLKTVRRVLQQEVGDNFESLLINQNASWRGRAQIICDLTQKNVEFKEKLKKLQEKYGSNNSSPHEVSKLEQKIGLLQRENIELKHSNDDLSKRCNVLKTKLKMVENEYGLIKTRYYSLNEQSERDQEFIDNLSSQLAHTKDLQSDGFKSRDKKIKKLKLENDALLSNVEKFKCQYDNATKLLDEKCREIEEIKKQKGQNLELKVVDEKTVSRLEAERMRLLELIEMEKKRFQSERDSHGETQNQLRFEKQRAAKLEASLARMELDQNVSKTGSYASSTSIIRAQDNISKLKDELELTQEQIKALKNRLEIEKREKNSDFKEFSKILQEFCKNT